MRTKNILLIITSLIAIQVSATTHRVNSNGFGAQYTDLQAAIDAAVAGDTLHIEGSAAAYGNGVLDKELHLFGPGYYLTENVGLQARSLEAQVPLLQLLPGAEGSTVSGLNIYSILQIMVGEITIRRNWLNEVRIHNGGNGAYSNVVLIQNWINSNVYHNFGGVPTITNLMFINCYIRGAQFGLATSVTGTMANCVSVTGISVWNMEIFNCIIKTGGYVLNNNTFHHNISHDAGLPAGNNNQLNVDMSTVFVSSGTTDGILQLETGSPAVGTGVSGDDIGMYGGASPYRLSGIPAIPSVYEYAVPATALEGSTINVTISTRTNN